MFERTFAWLHQFKRLRTRSERRADLHQGFLDLACSHICLRHLRLHHTHGQVGGRDENAAVLGSSCVVVLAIGEDLFHVGLGPLPEPACQVME